MRSPASDSAALYPEISETRQTPDSFDEYHKLRVDALRSVPPFVARDILQHEPQDSYRNVQVERDRRLRLIIRRYENQIQYGCHNRNCATTTCLSYRRRHSKTPARRYTDTSARALACHLVEEASRIRRDPTLGFCPNQPVVPWYQDPRTTHERRTAVAATPSRQSRKSQNGTARGPQEKRLSTTSHPVNGISGPSRRRSEPRKEDRDANGQPLESPNARSSSRSHARAPARDHSAAHSDNDTKPTLKDCDEANGPQDGVPTTPQRPPRTHEAIIAHREVDGRIMYLAVWHEGLDAKMAWSTEGTILDKAVVTNYKDNHGPADALDCDQLANLEAALEPMPITMIEDQTDQDTGAQYQQHEAEEGSSLPIIDFASFTQTLWNTLTLRQLASPKDLPTNDDSNIEQSSFDVVEEGEYNKDDTVGEISGSPPPSLHMNTAFCGFTLRRLSWDNLGWLMDNTKDKHQIRGSPFETFIKQSVYHSMGNPNRLIESAESWHWEEPEESDDELASVSSTTSSKAQAVAGENSQVPDPPSRHRQGVSDHPTIQFDADHTITAFQSLEGILESTDVLFDALHDTIQQCYNVDHPGYGGHKEAQLARTAFKGLGGGFYDASGKIAAIKGPTIQQIGQLPDRTQISRIFFLTLIAMVMPLFNYRWARLGFDSIGFITVVDLRGDNKAGFNAHARGTTTPTDRKALQVLNEVLDHLHDWHRCRLASALTDCISHHVAATEIRRYKSCARTKPRNVINETLELLGQDFEQRREGCDVSFRLMIAMGIIDVARTVLLQDWDRAPTISRTGSVGGALELLAAMHHRFEMFDLGHSASLFEMPFVAAAFDEMELPNDWLQFESTARQTHILSYPFLFETTTLVKYFRAINVTAMKASFETAGMVYTDVYTFLQTPNIPVYGGRDILNTLRPYMAKYFIMTVRREHLLEDAINQLWKRQKREILRPLRVRLGREEGEDGLDYGGVQQEFFRLAFAEAFNPDHGMFTVDARTRMTWFLPGSQEPLWRFEAIGLLMGLAVYNGVNLPINMPLAFYRKLLGFKVKKLEHIKDGWPDLEKGLRQLLEYDGDVAEDIGRTYEFSYEFAGKIYTKDISHGHDRSVRMAFSRASAPSRKGKEKVRSPTFEIPPAVSSPPVLQAFSASTSPDIDNDASSTSSPIPALDSAISISTPISTPSPSLAPSSPSIAPSRPPSTSEPPLVTNENRDRYIKDYITHLTDHSIAPQYAAFVRGVHACLHPHALHLFTPTQLRDLVEGERHIDIDDLERHANYEDYDRDDPYVRGFWEVVREETARDESWIGRLLEFVLASARVPIGGWGHGAGRGSFVLQRNGYEFVDADPESGEVAAGQVDGAAEHQPHPADAGAGADATTTPLAPADSSHISASASVPTPAAAAAAAKSSKCYPARLPSSSTCYARLLLPRYHVIGEKETDLAGTGEPPGTMWKEVLRERLCKAVEEGIGFGML